MSKKNLAGLNKSLTPLSFKRTVPYIKNIAAKFKEQKKGKASSHKIVALTAYDYTFATLIDSTSEVDLILVGDSAGSVIQGHDNTLPVTLEQMIYHTQCVSRGVKNALVVGDLPFMSYQVSIEQAITSAGRMIKEGGAEAVKLEGGKAIKNTVKRLTELDIPVVGHIGLTPQSYHRMGGYKIQGKSRLSGNDLSANEILQDAIALEDAGAFAIVVEGVPAELAKKISKKLSIPTIGIGAGSSCDGQILVINDMLGLNSDFNPRFVKKYKNLGEDIKKAVSEYACEVKNGVFPALEHTVFDTPIVKVAK